MKLIIVVDNQGGILDCVVNTVKQSLAKGFISAEKNLRHQTCPPALLAKGLEIGGLGEMCRQQSGDCSVMSGRGMIIWVISL